MSFLQNWRSCCVCICCICILFEYLSQMPLARYSRASPRDFSTLFALGAGMGAYLCTMVPTQLSASRRVLYCGSELQLCTHTRCSPGARPPRPQRCTCVEQTVCVRSPLLHTC